MLLFPQMDFRACRQALRFRVGCLEKMEKREKRRRWETKPPTWQALRLPGFLLLIDVLTLTSRASTEICDELEKMAAYLEALQTEGLPIGETSRIKRLHSDRVGEFTAPFFAPLPRATVRTRITHLPLATTLSNGTAERSVGLSISITALPRPPKAKEVFAFWYYCGCSGLRSSRCKISCLSICHWSLALLRSSQWSGFLHALPSGWWLYWARV